jgi:proton-coupled amino acid transporter
MNDHVGFTMSVYAYMGLLFVPFVLLTFVRSLKYLSPISMIANILQALGTAIIFYFLLRELKPIEDRPYVAPVAKWPLYFGTAIYAFEGIGIVSGTRKIFSSYGSMDGLMVDFLFSACIVTVTPFIFSVVKLTLSGL